MHLVRHSNGESVRLDVSAVLGSGGEARIYRVAGSASLAAKVYHRPTPEHRAKLQAMLANPPDDPLLAQGQVSIAWPLDLLLAPDGSGRLMGFLMPLARGMSPLIDFYHPRTRRRKHPLFHYRYLVRTARNLAACVGALHARGYVIGDLNESNILVSETALVTLVDTDSFQVPDLRTGRVYRCRVGKAEFTPPELQRVSFSQVDRKPEHDLFGLGVLIFQLLMEGTHPFAGRHVGVGEPPSLERRIGAGQFPYGDEPGGAMPMPSAPRFEHMDRRVRELLRRCFVEGFREPGRRPEAQLWQNTLDEVEEALMTCSANEQHRYGKHLASCPWCHRTSLLSGLDPFPSREAVQKHQHLRGPLKLRRRSAPRWAPRTITPGPLLYSSEWSRFVWILFLVAVASGMAAYWVYILGLWSLLFVFAVLGLVAYWVWTLGNP
jgi:DNA-binding helix-hairpin-helix protein with protein kinase domain